MSEDEKLSLADPRPQTPSSSDTSKKDDGLESDTKNESINVENNVQKSTTDGTVSGSSSTSSVNTMPKLSLGMATAKKTTTPTGAAAILKNIAKKSKLSTFEKSRLDWNSFKKENEIEDELDAYKKGKSGYLERQDFLQRADLRQFEIEKELRSRKRKMS